jgi:hypothetical protein
MVKNTNWGPFIFYSFGWVFFSRKTYSPTRPLLILTNWNKSWTHVIICDYLISVQWLIRLPALTRAKGFAKFLRIQRNSVFASRFNTFYILAYSFKLKCIIYELTEQAPCGAVVWRRPLAKRGLPGSSTEKNSFIPKPKKFFQLLLSMILSLGLRIRS